MQVFFLNILTVSAFRLCWFCLFYISATSMHTLHTLIWPICPCPSEPPLCLFWRRIWVLSLLFLLLVPWHLVHPFGGSEDLLFQSKCPPMRTDLWALCSLLLNLISKKKKEIPVRRCENICLQHKRQCEMSWSWRCVCATCIWYSTLARLLFFPSGGQVLSVQRRRIEGGEVGLGHPLDSWKDMFIFSVMDGGGSIPLTPPPIYFNF